MSVRPEKVLLEPISKNTAPALTLAAIFLLNNFDDAVLFSMPSDHFIEEDKNFFQAVELAHRLAEEGGIVTFGIDIKKPDVNFGYIKKGIYRKIAILNSMSFTRNQIIKPRRVCMNLKISYGIVGCFS